MGIGRQKNLTVVVVEHHQKTTQHFIADKLDSPRSSGGLLQHEGADFNFLRARQNRAKLLPQAGAAYNLELLRRFRKRIVIHRVAGAGVYLHHALYAFASSNADADLNVGRLLGDRNRHSGGACARREIRRIVERHDVRFEVHRHHVLHEEIAAKNAREFASNHCGLAGEIDYIRLGHTEANAAQTVVHIFGKHDFYAALARACAFPLALGHNAQAARYSRINDAAARSAVQDEQPWFTVVDCHSQINLVVLEGEGNAQRQSWTAVGAYETWQGQEKEDSQASSSHYS